MLVKETLPIQPLLRPARTYKSTETYDVNSYTGIAHGLKKNYIYWYFLYLFLVIAFYCQRRESSRWPLHNAYIKVVVF